MTASFILEPQGGEGWPWKLGTSLEILLLFLVGIAFTRRQFNLREHAARTAWATEGVLLATMARAENLQGEEMAPPDPDQRTSPASGTALSRARRLLGVFFPRRLSAENNVFNKAPLVITEIPPPVGIKRAGPGRFSAQLEGLAYLFMLVRATAVVIGIWV